MNKPLLACALAAACLLAGAAPSSGAEDPVRELEALTGRIDAARRFLAEKEEEERSLLGEMERLDQAIAARTSRIAELRGAEMRLARDARESARRVESLRLEEENTRARLEGRVVALYKYGQEGLKGLLLAARVPEERERRQKYLTVATRSDADLLRRARLLYEEQRRAFLDLAERQDRLERTREALAAELADLSGRKDDKSRLLQGIRGARETQVAVLGEMETAADRLNRMIEEMRRGEGAESGFGAARGALPRPVSGPVVLEFGRHRNPRFDTYTISRGITIKAPEGTPALAVFRGKVLFADWFRGYGRIVILDHGGGYYTLYGHLATQAVAAGDEVTAGQAVGAVGETGSLEGPALYFEIRRHGKPEDPKPWFAPKPKAGGNGKP